MKRPLIILGLLALTACHAEEQNGDLRLIPAPILSHQAWGVLRQTTTTDHRRICTVSAGDLEVTQITNAQGKITTQIETTYDMNPGSTYVVRVGDQRFETSQSYFNAQDSAALLMAMRHADTVYTEWRKINHDVGEPWLWGSNRISLSGFAEQLGKCDTYLADAAQHGK